MSVKSAGAMGVQPPTNIHDPVHHPKHYTAHPSGIECIQVTEHFNFNLGNAIKYLWRAGLKGAKLQDLEKARWYLDREIQRVGIPPERSLSPDDRYNT